MRAPNDPDYWHHDSRTPPEAALVFAVLSRAIQDLFGSVGTAVTPDAVSVVRHAALHFWTSETGDAAKDRGLLCSFVGFDGGAMRERVISILEGDDRPIAAYVGYCELKFVKEAREIWATRKQQLVNAQTARKAKAATPKPIAAQVMALPTKPITEDEDMNRTERRKTVMRMLKHGPTTARELSDATGQSITTRQISGFLYHAEKEGLVQRDGDLWALVSQTKAAAPALPQLSVAANLG